MSDLSKPTRRSARPFLPLGEYLAAKRKQAGLTQRQVADALQYSAAQFISNFERGVYVPPMNKLRQLTDLYRLSVEEVLDVILACESDRIRRALANAPKAKKKEK